MRGDAQCGLGASNSFARQKSAGRSGPLFVLDHVLGLWKNTGPVFQAQAH